MTKFRYDSAREAEPARAFLVSVALGAVPPPDARAELEELTLSDALTPVGYLEAKRDRPDPATFLGRGKIEEIGQRAARLGASVIVFDAPLSAVQERNISRLCERPVLDRTELILAIFERRARSREGRLQVELARLEHLSTRLVRGWTHLERQRGGLGKTGGPGEKQLELDRRQLAGRVKALRGQLARLRRQRDTQRRGRFRSGVPMISLVGYTNAGKSTLFNRLTRADSYVADQLFATLDTTARRWHLGPSRSAVLSDTVGFIRGLPHQLIDAFRATLDEATQADLLLHVVDDAAAAREERVDAVRATLAEIGAGEIPLLTVFNKADLGGRPGELLRDPRGSVKSVAVSALTGAGIEELRQAVAERLDERRERRPDDPAAGEGDMDSEPGPESGEGEDRPFPFPDQDAPR